MSHPRPGTVLITLGPDERLLIGFSPWNFEIVNPNHGSHSGTRLGTWWRKVEPLLTRRKSGKFRESLIIVVAQLDLLKVK